ncbi:MAG: hypothetical protein SFU25_10585 [Candidatus Caenarcaniphilales bacterium]|nr:hypothetical protein [Candidatus Caenarcaniphilales bacterium]
MSKKYFWGKKYILTSGREVDLSCEEDNNKTVEMIAQFNHLDAIHEITKPISVRLEWQPKSNDPLISVECRGGAPGDSRPVSESELPVEGLNGSLDKLKASEFIELLETMKGFYSKIQEEDKAASKK